MKIQLPPFLLAEIYKDNLVMADELPANTPLTESKQPVSIPATTKMPTETAVPAKWFLGDNKKNITIIVTDEKHVFLDDESLNLLTGILSACKLTLADVAIVNYRQTPLSNEEISEQLKPRQVFLFNLTTQALGLPFSIPHYQVQQYGGCTYLSAVGLLEMTVTSEEAKLEKTRLWVFLKKIFWV